MERRKEIMPGTFVISDTHFSHAKIIRLCKRPFETVKDMDATMLDNWNKTVSKHDTVYFLGDLSWHGYEYWIKQLNGNIIFVRGNHDPAYWITFKMLTIDNIRLLMVHNPKYISYYGWLVHGHIHNNDIVNYPFINRKTKTINVSAELVNYTPVNIDEIIRGIKNERQN